MAASACVSDDKDIGTASTASGAAPKVRYAYDPLGRLVQAASFDGTAVQYSYDAVGNITAIRRLAPGALRVVDFTPPSGTLGSTVAVFGSGFSASASENTVAFNGTAATVTSATETALTVTVPVGATTGKITVTSAAGSATSSRPVPATGWRSRTSPSRRVSQCRPRLSPRRCARPTAHR